MGGACLERGSTRMGGWVQKQAGKHRAPQHLSRVQECACVSDVCVSAVGLHVAGLSGHVKVPVRPVSAAQASLRWASPVGMCRDSLI